MKKPAIILTGPHLDAVSGVATHLRLILDSNLKEKFHFIHFQVGSQGRSENRFQKLFRLLSSPFQLGLMVWRKKPVLVHLNPSMDPKSFWRDSFYVFIVKTLKCRVIYQLHGGEMPERFCEKNPLYKFILLRILKAADKIVLLGDYAVNAYEKFCPGLPLHKIPNSIKTEDLEPPAPKQLKEHNFMVGYIGRLCENKGILETIEAISFLKEESFYEKLTFKIAGSGPAEGLISEKIRAVGLEDRVLLIGPVFGEDKLSFWKQIDLFVFPTYHKEGLPYSLLESLASGTPMITTREGGISEIVKEGEHALFVGPRDPGKIAEAMRKLYGKDKNHYVCMSQACIDLAKRKFGIQVMEKEFSELYSELVSLHDMAFAKNRSTFS